MGRVSDIIGGLLIDSGSQQWYCSLIAAPLSIHKNIYRFQFNVHSPLMGGACHFLDIPYVFGAYKIMGCLCPNQVEANSLTSQAVIKAWTNFAQTGDPNLSSKIAPATETTNKKTATLPPWPRWSASEGSKVMIIDVPLSLSRVQSMKVHEAFPELWKIAAEDARVRSVTQTCNHVRASCASSYNSIAHLRL